MKKALIVLAAFALLVGCADVVTNDVVADQLAAAEVAANGAGAKVLPAGSPLLSLATEEMEVGVVTASGDVETQVVPVIKKNDYNPRYFDHQAVVLPNGRSVVTSSYMRDGLSFLWMNHNAPVGIFNAGVWEGEEIFEYYLLSVKLDVYCNYVTAREIDEETYFAIIAEYEGM